MKARNLTIAVALLGTAWTSNVIYKQHVHEVISRGIASQMESGLNFENIKKESEEIAVLIKEIKDKESLLSLSMNKKDVTHEELLKLKDDQLKEIKSLKKEVSERLSQAEVFVERVTIKQEVKEEVEEEAKEETKEEEKAADVKADDKPERPEMPNGERPQGPPPKMADGQQPPQDERPEDKGEVQSAEAPAKAAKAEDRVAKLLADASEEDIKIVEEAKEALKVSRKSFDELGTEKLEIALTELLKQDMDYRVSLQEEALENLQNSVCSQNQKLEKLTDKLEKLLEDKEKVIDKMDENQNQNNLLSMLPFFMSPNSFFGQSSFPFNFGMNTNQSTNQNSLSNSAQNLGVDTNFMMLTSLLANTNGLGQMTGSNGQQGSSINYSPVYNYNQSYMGQPSFMSQGSNGQMNNQQSNFPMQQQGQNQNGQQGLFTNPFTQSQQTTNAGQTTTVPQMYQRGNALQSTNSATTGNSGQFVIQPNSVSL